MNTPTTIQSVADLGAVIRAERKAQGFTQSELAEACNVGITFISNLERGKEATELGKTLRVLTMLGVDIIAAKRGE